MNHLTDLPQELARLTGLRSLILEQNMFESIPRVLRHMECLEVLDFSLNPVDLTEPFPRAWEERLKELLFQHRSISMVHSTIGRLTSLTKLHISRATSLTELPQSICLLKNLKQLIIYDNQLKVLPSNLGRCKKLTYLDVSGNRLRYLPSLPVKEMNLHLGKNDFFPLNDSEFDGPSLPQPRPSLRAIAATKVLSLGLPDKELPRDVLSYLDTSRICDREDCTNRYLEEFRKNVWISIPNYENVPMKGNFCSPHCSSSI